MSDVSGDAPRTPRRGRRRRGVAIHGWLVIDKPLGMSSAAAVAAVKRRTGAAKVGHGGTLDPLASGVLPIALGEATKTVSYIMDGAKIYRFTVQWGEARSTDDCEGEITETSAVRPSAVEIEAALDRFRGDIEQVPPVYSAIKIDGRRAYARARADEDVVMAPRRVHVARFDCLSAGPDSAEFEVECGKGTYIRSLARDLARAVATVGHVSALRRMRVGPFRIEDSIFLESEDPVGHSAPLIARLLPIETALDDIPALAVVESEARRLRNGQPVPIIREEGAELCSARRSDGLVCVFSDGKPLALARIEDGFIRPVRGLNVE